MKILYDHQMFSYQKFGGITKYFVELIKNISPEHQCHLSVLFSENHYLKENHELFKKLNLLPSKDFKGKATAKEMLALLNKKYSRYRIASNNYDLFHPTFYDDYFLENIKKPYVVTVHDLIEFIYQDSFFKDSLNRPYMEKVIGNAHRIIAISEHTKMDLLRIFNLDPGKIDVIYHGFNGISTRKKSNHFGKYLLFVGERGGYKNFTGLVEAVSGLLKKDRAMKLVCVGKPFSTEEIELFQNAGIEEQLFALNVSEATLNELYSHALVFVYPSLYEGFGMPILEAFSNNCPVCLSDTSCFPEIAGEAAAYFDPSDKDSMAGCIEEVIYNKEVAEKLRKAGKIRLQDFSWQKTSQLTLKTYQKALQS
jgi:glycosyltransferase involved in cell wall biosynthesis